MLWFSSDAQWALQEEHVSSITSSYNTDHELSFSERKILVRISYFSFHKMATCRDMLDLDTTEASPGYRGQLLPKQPYGQSKV